MKFIKKKTFYPFPVYEFNLPAGHSCPFARDCKIKVDRITGKFEKIGTKFRCYAASSERFPAVRESRWKNFEDMLSGKEIEIPKDATHIRIHSSGDFFSQEYFDRWLETWKKRALRDNQEYGEWDKDILANAWEEEIKLLDMPELNFDELVGFDKKVEGENEFTEELMEEKNYIVLKFDNQIDWLNLVSMFDLPSVKALDSKDGFEKIGVGRVVDGANFLDKLKDEWKYQ